MSSLPLVLVLIAQFLPLLFASLPAAMLNPEDISLPPRDPKSQSVDEYCRSFQFSVLSGNLLSWRVPAECVPFVRDYVGSRQYKSDLQASMSLSLQKAQTFCARPGIDAWFFHVDGTLLSTTPYFATKNFGAGIYNDTDFNLWAARGIAPAVAPVRDFYQTLLRTNWTVFLVSTRPESLRAVTVRNLRAAGYGGWKWLFMRRPLFQTQGGIHENGGNSLAAMIAAADSAATNAGFHPQGVTSNLHGVTGDIPHMSYVPDTTGNS